MMHPGIESTLSEACICAFVLLDVSRWRHCLPIHPCPPWRDCLTRAVMSGRGQHIAVSVFTAI